MKASSTVAVMPSEEAQSTKKRKPKKSKSKSVSDLSFQQQEPADADMTVGNFVTDETPSPDVSETDSKRPNGLKKFRRGLKSLFLRKSVKNSTKNQVEEITIIQEDDTDYEKQWSRKVTRAASFGGGNLLTTPTTANSTSSRTNSSSGSASSSKQEDDGIPVILDADDEDH